MNLTTLDNPPRSDAGSALERLADEATGPLPTFNPPVVRPSEESRFRTGRLATEQPAADGTSAAAADRGFRFRWLSRSRRVLLLLGAVWVLNIFDLGYTVLESTRGSFIEMNPVAAPILSAPTYVLVMYKAALVLTSSTILLALRRSRLVEMSCWFLLAAYLYVAVRWIMYYEDLLSSLNDPAVNISRLAG